MQSFRPVPRGRILRDLALVVGVLALAACQPKQAHRQRIELPLQPPARDMAINVPRAGAMLFAYYHDAPQAPCTVSDQCALRAQYEALVSSARAIGYDWRIEFFQTTPKGFDVGLAAIETELTKAQPPLIGLSDGVTVHLVIVNGFDDVSQTVSITDPDRDGTRTRILSFSEFRQSWRDSANGAPLRTLIRTRKMPPPGELDDWRALPH